MSQSPGANLILIHRDILHCPAQESRIQPLNPLVPDVH